MIYCGYQGSGKSTYCRNNPTTTVDLDSSAFKKFNGWEEGYVKTAQELSEHKNIFISAHKVVIDYLIDNKIAFEVLAPSMNKEAWRSRLEFRYFKNPTLPNKKAVADFEENYDKDMAFYKSLADNGIAVHWIEAKVITNIADFIE